MQTLQLKKKNRLLPIVFLTLCALGVYIFRGELSNLFTASRIATSDIRDFAREISTPGALVSRIESSNAFLTEGGVFEYTNIERAKEGLTPLVASRGLSDIAKERLDDMFLYQYFEHVSPKGESASTVAVDLQYEYIAIGENIALGNFENDQALVQAWMDSPGHRANILSGKYTALGVAVGKGIYEGKTTWIGVQIFARPLSACPLASEELKQNISLARGNIQDLDNEITRVEKELEQAKKNGDYDTYNALVEAYNNLAREINNQSAALKVMVDEYNSKVRAFNACAGV